jgi:hypothetical protein
MPFQRIREGTKSVSMAEKAATIFLSSFEFATEFLASWQYKYSATMAVVPER